jgi:hypothetical protein
MVDSLPFRSRQSRAITAVTAIRSKLSTAVSRKLAVLKVINLEEGMPTVEQARLRMGHELHKARGEGCKAVKLIHGYGSSGAGGILRLELQKELGLAAQSGAIQALIPGEEWRVSDPTTWDLLKRFPEWKQDSDLGRSNRGISIVVL